MLRLLYSPECVEGDSQKSVYRMLQSSTLENPHASG